MICLLGFASNSHFLHLRCLHAAFPAATAACRSGTLVPRLSQAPRAQLSGVVCITHMHKVKRLQFFYIANVLNLNFCSQTYCRRIDSVGSIILDLIFLDKPISELHIGIDFKRSQSATRFHRWKST